MAITLAGFPLGATVTRFQYRDVHHGEVDDIEFALADPDGRWRSGLGPIEGTEVSARIGYLDDPAGQAACGLYRIDERSIQLGAGGDTAAFRGLSAFTSQDMRTARSEAFDEISLQQIVDRIANRHGMQVLGPVPNVTFRRVTQSKTDDLAFLLRLAEDWGCYCNAKGDTLVFADRRAIDAQEPAYSFDVSDQAFLDLEIDRSSARLYKSATLTYVDTATRTTITAEASDPRVQSGDRLILDDKVETQAQADRLCLARLLRANDDWTRGRLTVVGEPYLVAGQVLLLGPTLGEFAGRYLVTSAEHVMADGYTTTVQIRGL
ncbi:phage late control D family protein [Loktanella sp. 3ANDIMAR09]|uniref:phage late control D family protein n=1 Tax=Loktanella sp. 3ANDIMAR09 TaxID=1225657 RepID=UPI00155F195C|nr:contractile injection system protein, VgrG/Pvc8 family [Loktanella sp. 3ANDIMAR09]